MNKKYKVFYLEDHSFFADTIIEVLKEYIDDIDIYYCKSYAEAEKTMKKYGPFTHSIIDVFLQNGKTGILFVEKHFDLLGKTVFVTGSKDRGTIETLNNKNYNSISKIYQSAEEVMEFIIHNTAPKISLDILC
jgi:hypothetical protein